ncbi:MAG: sporulation protein YqfC [Limnochordia bacterium]|jgi:sporulation protein YqfC|nr:sporulation protein YqfC [Limnochordia bacterium]MDD2628723.1 sporulation protein YqfC [Limnochordia bacterium]MDD4517161.1 sporulation protein YqfC [Limnochordia bacterium]
MPLTRQGYLKLLKRLIRAFELPEDVVLDLPRITMVGKYQLYVGNHRGILEFSQTQVRIQSKYGPIGVKGQKMRIISITNNELMIDGLIDQVLLDGAQSNREGAN